MSVRRPDGPREFELNRLLKAVAAMVLVWVVTVAAIAALLVVGAGVSLVLQWAGV